MINVTPRTTLNTKMNTLHVLKYLTWVLNTNINLIGIREIRNTCHQNKYFFYYIFQNTLVKLLRQNQLFNAIHIIYYKKQYFILSSPEIFPILINIPPLSSITFNQITLTSQDIKQIIDDNTLINLPFSVKIFTSYYYIHQSSKQLHSNCIGQYCTSDPLSSPTLQIFVTPTLTNHEFLFHQLKVKDSNITFSRKNLFSHPRANEGQQIRFQKSSPPKTLNQKKCICQHEETERISPPRHYSHLGIFTCSKNLLFSRV